MSPHPPAASWLLSPVIAPLLRQRGVAAILGVCGIAQIVVGWMGQSLIPCPMLEVVHVPCPGCGITRAIHLALAGRIHESLHLHAFAAFFLLAAALFAVGACMPTPAGRALVRRIETIELRFPIALVLLLALVLYWAGRLIYSRGNFIDLMRGA